MLNGTPTGVGLDAFCDSCNRYLEAGDDVRVYVTAGRGDRLSLRWVSCSTCGPCGDATAAEDGELHAVATLRSVLNAPSPRLVLTDARLDPDVSHEVVRR
ncbi:hypothetical protein GQS65_01205 [Halomarina oriensis]|uniref:Uncharacterized protein n=2 Tax=Halomarina oriensis TaxID=671145 RepID=A0A6B0GGM6_9EURY|nr:hypothetical protein [Halomarina oriensis]